MKKIITLLLALVLPLCAPICALAATPDESDFLSRYAQEPYVVTDCQMQVVVSEYNVLAVTETYQVYFNEARHGIYRYLPLRNQLTRTDGSTAVVTARVSHVDTGADECSHEVSNDKYVLRLGSEDETITGPHTYTIRYNYDLGLDTVKNADELYYNLVGTGWDTYIRRVQFSVTMPKDFDPAKLGLSTGSYGTAGTKNVTYTVQDRTISGTVTQALAPGEGLTLRLILPDGYFKFDNTKYNLTIAMIAVLPALAALIVLRKNATVKSLDVIVPIMAVCYFVMTVIIIAVNFRQLPAVLGRIFSEAFGLRQVAAGGFGAVLMNGVKRGLFSNEAGSGSAPCAAAAASCDDPVKMGFVQALGVLIDTVVICSCTAFMMLLAPANVTTGLTGMDLLQAAAQYHLGSFGVVFIAVTLALFSFSTFIGILFYARSNVAYLFGDRWGWQTAYKVLALVMLMVGGLEAYTVVWDLGDVGIGLMTIFNLIALYPMSGEAIAALRDYERRKHLTQN